MIVKDLSNSFNPCPKNITKKEKTPTRIKQKSNKLAKKEKNRFSIITTDLEKCYLCKAKKEDLHEIYEGKNRQLSMKYGLVIPICRKCHISVTNNKTLQEKLHKVGQKVFKKYYKTENFVKIFGKNYLDD
ncbi:MAG TPA: hypothetical protein OIM45_04985 [Clostridiaceae bacterium]|nr:hypothetical protein [Clostridiaceae bacterium]